MDPKQMAKQMFDFNKAVFEKSYSTTVMMQDQTEKIFDGWINKVNWLPEEGKKSMTEWVNTCKKGREEFKTSVDEGYRKMAEYLTGSDK